MYCPRCGKPSLDGSICIPCLTDQEYENRYGLEREYTMIAFYNENNEYCEELAKTNHLRQSFWVGHKKLQRLQIVADEL